MKKEITYCDTCGEDLTNHPATRVHIYIIGENSRELEMCRKCSKSWIRPMLNHVKEFKIKIEK